LSDGKKLREYAGMRVFKHLQTKWTGNSLKSRSTGLMAD